MAGSASTAPVSYTHLDVYKRQPVDVEFNCETGCITALVVPGPGSFCFCFWGAGSEYIIPWNCIRQIGDDIILVEIDEKYCCKKA